MRTFEYTIKDELGIHARPAGQLAKIAKGLDSEITVAKGDKTVNASRLLALMGMGVKQGDRVIVSVSGGNEEESEAAMKIFFETNL